MLRTAGVFLGCVLLAGCSSTDTASVQAKTATGLPDATTAYAAAPRQLPVLAYKGYWFVADDTERDCTVEFRTEARDANGGIYAAHPTGECVSSLKHIAGWGLNNGSIVLYTRDAQAVGVFSQSDVINYSGELTIDTGQTFTARLRKIA